MAKRVATTWVHDRPVSPFMSLLAGSPQRLSHGRKMSAVGRSLPPQIGSAAQATLRGDSFDFSGLAALA